MTYYNNPMLDKIHDAFRMACALFFSAYAEADDAEREWSEAVARMENPDLPYDTDDYIIYLDALERYNDACDLMHLYETTASHLELAMRDYPDCETSLESRMIKEVEFHRSHYSSAR